MLITLVETLKKVLKSKIFPMICVYTVLFSIICGRIFYLQIIKGEELEETTETAKKKEREIPSPRGNIYDCNGKLLASNVQTYAITIEDLGVVKESAELNKVIYDCIRIIEKNKNKLDLEFAITIDKRGRFRYTMPKTSIRRFKKDIFYKEAGTELTADEDEMKAKEVFMYLRDVNNEHKNTFRIGPEYTDEEALKIMTVRYAIIMNRYKKYVPITLSKNVNKKTIAAIKENSAALPGVDVVEELNRRYYSSEYFAHIIGYTGVISPDLLAQMQEDEQQDTTYTPTEQIGKTGIESTFEDVLRGKKGKETLIIDEASRVSEVRDRVDAVAGNDIYLSIDKDLQIAYYKILEKKIAGILVSKLNNGMDAGSKGESASNIRIPVYDVYNAIIQNNVVDINRFLSKDATSLERNIYRRFHSAKKRTDGKIKSELSYSNSRHGSQLSESLQEYIDYIYSLLLEREILTIGANDKSDATYVKYVNGKISLSKFLEYAISQNWINLEYLEIGNDYYSTEEIFKKLVKAIFEILNEDSNYDKQIYKNMIYDNDLSGREVCLLLYSQKVIKKKNSEMENLRSGSLSAYEFVKSKIRSLDITPGQLGLEPCSGSVVITDVNTGKIKAMVSYPSYDNNKFAGSVDSEYFARINSNKAAPLLNRSTQQKTAPGSTYKMLVASASLEEGIINPYSTVTDKTTFTNIHPSPKCWSTNSSHGTINVTQAIRDSCNYFFYEMGFRLGDGHGENVNNEKGLNKLKKYAKIYGLTEPSGVELAESDPTISDIDTVRSAIGQGTNSYTPVQLSRYVTTIANQGTCYDLTIIDKIESGKDKKVKKNKAVVYGKLPFADSTWSAITQGMRLVVKDGTIRSLFTGLPVDVAGKTGTAQESVFKPNHALFVSYAPYENPEISVTAVIANGYTSSNAAELASDVYKYYFDKKSRKRLLEQKVSAPQNSSGAVTD